MKGCSSAQDRIRRMVHSNAILILILIPRQRVSWKLPGDPIEVLAMQIGHNVTEDSVWGKVARKIACDVDFSSHNRVILGEALADRLVEGDADVHAPDSSLCLDVSDTSEAAMDSELSEAINSLREQLTPYCTTIVSCQKMASTETKVAELTCV